MTTQVDNNHLSFLRFLQREAWLEVSGYHVGDVQSPDKPVLVTGGTAVVGSIFAPKVRIAGLVCGSIVTLNGIIAAGGQVWGDCFAARLELERGGKLQGWFSTIPAETAVTLIDERQLPVDTTAPDLSTIPDGMVDPALLNRRDEAELAAYHQLLAELATALAARQELEKSFDRRLSEVAGEASSKVAELSEQLAAQKEQTTHTTAQLAEAEATLQSQLTQLNHQQEELSLSRDLIESQKRELAQLQQTKQQLSEKLAQETAVRQTLETNLQEKNAQLAEQTDRLHNLEAAAQGAFQHSSELEDSLMRWQELAEVTEKRAEELAEELQKAQFQLGENGKMVEMLREQKKEIEAQWQATQNELEEMRRNPTRPLPELGKLSIEEAFTAAHDEIERLQVELEEVEQERAEQILWYRANEEASQAELDQLRLEVSTQQKKIAQLKAESQRKAILMEQWKTAANQMSEQLRDATNHSETEQEDFTEKVAALEEALRERDARIKVSEEDIEFHLSEMEKQGKHLADIQAILVERELQLRQARALIQKQNATLKTLREKAADHIQKLQRQLQQQQMGQK